jgi:hypothetical protein
VSGAASAPLLVGLDGGASSAKACVVTDGTHGLSAAAQPVEEVYGEVEGFVPVARDDARKRPYPAGERQLALAWVDAAARAVARAAGTRVPILLGAALPGLKTPDQRGLFWARHGPRIPDYLARLELELASLGVELAAPIAGLFSDGDCCGLGEERGEQGNFRGVANAWYVGGGTGLAEAFKVRGEVVEMDRLAPNVKKAWQLFWRGEHTFEDMLSISGLNEQAHGFVEEFFGRSDVVSVMIQSMNALADLAQLRANDFERAGWGPLERVVVGQRLGLLLGSFRFQELRKELSEALEKRGLPRDGWLVFSSMREAPALGAAARAFDAWRQSRAE